MKILFLTQFFSSSRGGGSLTFFELAKALSARGHKLFVICNVAETIDSTNVEVTTIKPSLNNAYELPLSPTQNLRYIVNSVILGSKIAREQKIDIIHTNSFTPVIAGSIISKLRMIPMAVTIHDTVSNIAKDNWKKWVSYNKLPRYYPLIARLYEQLSLRMPFDVIHAVSNTTKNDVLLIERKKTIRVIYQSIDDRHYEGINHKYENFILYIGRLVFYKNVDVLINAYEEVLKVLPTARLVVVGEGPMADVWKNLAESMGISDNIVFTNHLSNEEKVNLLSRCSALALPSLYEGFGLVILESFAMAKPVLVANIPPLDEIVDQEVNGFLITYNDPHEWAKMVIKLLSNKEMCEKMGRNALRKLKEKYNFEKYIETMEDLYQELSRTAKK